VQPMRSARTSLLALAALATIGGSVLLGAAAANADPVYSEGACVISRTVDNGPGGAQCAGADLSGSKLAEANFRDADLTGASFANGDVQGAIFTGANLTGADFSGARVVGADFSGSGIVPASIEVPATSAAGAAVSWDVAPPAGMTVDGCSIVGAPVDPGATFPIGSSGILCTLSTSSDKGTASAVIKVDVTAQATATPTIAPLFTDTPAPVAAQQTGSTGGTPNWLMIGGFVGGAVVVAGGVAALVVSNRRGRAE
jgi:hypothetical protein